MKRNGAAPTPLELCHPEVEAAPLQLDPSCRGIPAGRRSQVSSIQE